MKEYLLAVRREHRAAMGDDWLDAIRHLEGVEVVSEDDRLQMIRIKASDKAMEAIRKEFADWIHIEEPARHETRE